MACVIRKETTNVKMPSRTPKSIADPADAPVASEIII
jgi:hypothetical protein